MFNEYIENIKKLSAKMGAIIMGAAKENRALSAKEAGVVAELETAIDAERKHLPENSPLSMGKNFSFGHDQTMASHDRGLGLRGPGETKDYQALFGARDSYTWPDKEATFFNAVFSGRFHPGLIRGAMTETVPSDGGYLVPGQLAEKIHAVSLENEIVMPRCFVQPMKSNEIDIPAMEIGDHSANLYGGFTASYTAEAGTISEADPKVRSMKLNAKKLTGLIRFSAELAEDIPGGESQLINICGKGLAWYRDKAFLKGTGAGEPLGILHAGCTIEVEKETGQAADSIMYENLTEMLGRLHPACFNNSIWICQVSAIPQLLQLSMSVGTGGSFYPVLTESNGQWRILSRPVIFTEKTEPLGDKGDIILADLSQYVVGLRSGMRFDQSIHVHFTTDELLARLIERHDGQPLWSEALTLEDGANTVSPFITLEERA